MNANPEDPIVILGAGIVGLACALRLREREFQVTLIDRQAPGDGASFGNAGILSAGSIVPTTMPGLFKKIPRMLLHPDGPLFLRWRYLPRLMPWLMKYLSYCDRHRVAFIAQHMTPLVHDSLDQHQALAKETPAATHIREINYYFAYANRQAYEAEPFGWNLRRDAGLQWQTYDGPVVREIEPNLGASYGFLAGFEHQHGIIDHPGDYVKALAQVFVDRGGKITQAEIIDIDQGPSGPRGFITKDHEVIGFSRAVLAGGAWSAGLAQKLGHKVPLESERGYHLHIRKPSLQPRNALMATDGKFVAAAMGSDLRVAGLLELAGLRAGPNPAALALLHRGIKRLLPDLVYDDALEWLGHRPALCDNLPVIGASQLSKAVYYAFGHQHVGLTAGPKTGRIIADLIAGKPGNLDLGAYSIDRFKSPRNL